MKGRFVALRRPYDADFELIEQWLAPESMTAVLTTDAGGLVTARQVRELNESGAMRHYMVWLLDEDRAVGCVNYKRSGPAGCFEIGGAIGEADIWQRGYGIEAFTLLVDHLFHAGNAHRVQFTTAIYNRHIINAVTKAAFVCEGILREYYFLDGRWHDAVLWSVLRDEFYHGAEIAARISDRYRLPDIIPERDKAAARETLARFLAGDRDTTSIGQFLNDRPAAVAEREQVQ
ncbi:GNAT family N-acetyltransferase [Salinispora vitiensis]|uniref:GNAT family N-acetyltransferase n=1 Tax=Salinispora vitiensis TaxID=999544 RepID=UPI0003633873|nr:GNAT family protein [Salinispora vitiensis]